MGNGFEFQGEAEERKPSTAQTVDDHCTEFVFCDLLVSGGFLSLAASQITILVNRPQGQSTGPLN